jgi:hypothetical protein
VRAIVRAISDEAVPVEEVVARAGGAGKVAAVLSFVIGALAMLLKGVRHLFTNWRLLLIEVLPALWIWLAMLDIKLHVLHGKSFKVLHGPVLIPLALVVIAITAACFFLNAVFAFAISERGTPIGTAFAQARRNPRPPLVFGAVVGALLAFAALVAPRWSSPWFALLMGIAVGLLMVSYVAIPSRMIGVRPGGSRRDRLTASALSSAVGATVCTPPYILGRVGILMLGSKILFIPGVLFLLVGTVLQMGANGAVRAVKLGAVLTSGGAEQGEESGQPAESAPAR